MLAPNVPNLDVPPAAPVPNNPAEAGAVVVGTIPNEKLPGVTALVVAAGAAGELKLKTGAPTAAVVVLAGTPNNGPVGGFGDVYTLPKQNPVLGAVVVGAAEEPNVNPEPPVPGFENFSSPPRRIYSK